MFNLEKDLGFIVLCPELKFGGIKTTLSTIKNNFPETKTTCVISSKEHIDDFKIMSSLCSNIVKGGETTVSMINAGIKNVKKDWNLIVIAGCVIRYKPLLKYVHFTETEMDILYKVTDKKNWTWDASSIHGMLFHKKAFKEIGPFPENTENYKLAWWEKATNKNYMFKGLVGVRLI